MVVSPIFPYKVKPSSIFWNKVVTLDPMELSHKLFNVILGIGVQSKAMMLFRKLSMTSLKLAFGMTNGMHRHPLQDSSPR